VGAPAPRDHAKARNANPEGIRMSDEVAMTPDQMRQRTDQLNASVRERNKALRADAREARQLAWVAQLTEQAECVRAEYEGAKRRLPALKKEENAALAARDAAAARVRAEEDALALRRSERAALKADLTPGDEQEKAAERVKTREGVVADVKAALGKAEGKYAEAREKHAAWRSEVDELYRDLAEAERAVRNPGTAPGDQEIAPGVDGINDMDEDTCRLFGLLMMSMAATAQRSPEPSPRGGLDDVLHDSTRFRAIRTGNHNIHVIPPAMH